MRKFFVSTVNYRPIFPLKETGDVMFPEGHRDGVSEATLHSTAFCTVQVNISLHLIWRISIATITFIGNDSGR